MRPLRALDDLIRQGKVRYIGTNTFAAWQLVEALWRQRSLGSTGLSANTAVQSARPQDRAWLLPFCRTYGVGVIPWAPIAED